MRVLGVDEFCIVNVEANLTAAHPGFDTHKHSSVVVGQLLAGGGTIDWLHLDIQARYSVVGTYQHCSVLGICIHPKLESTQYERQE